MGRNGADIVLMGVAGAAAVASLTCAQPVGLLRTGDQLAGQSVMWVGNPTVTHSGGYAVAVTTQGSGPISHVWGTHDGAPPDLLRSEQAFGVVMQAAFERRFGMCGKGKLAYSADLLQKPIGFGDSVWLNDVQLLASGQAVASLSGTWYARFCSWPGITDDGQPYWIGGVSPTPTGPATGRGLFYGTDAQPILISGQTLPGLAAPLSTVLTVGPAYAFSADGNNYIAQVMLAPPGQPGYGAVAVNGEAITAGGTPVHIDAPVLASGAPAQKAWKFFDRVGITQSGTYFLAARVGPLSPTALSDTSLVMVDGHARYCQGRAVNSATLTGPVRDVAMNENRDLAVVWDTGPVPPGSQQAPQSLFLNGLRVLNTGDEVDLDGDGVSDPGSGLTGFSSPEAIAISDRTLEGLVTLYFVAAATSPTHAAMQCLFALTLAPASPCRTDWDHNSLIQPADVAAFTQAWYADVAAGTTVADFDNTGTTDSADLAAFIAQWFADSANPDC